MKQKRDEWTYHEWVVPKSLDDKFLLRQKAPEKAQKEFFKQMEKLLAKAKWKNKKDQHSY